MFCNNCWDHFTVNEVYIQFGIHFFCCNTCYQYWLKKNVLPVINTREIYTPRMRIQCKNCKIRQNMSKTWIAKHL